MARETMARETSTSRTAFYDLLGVSKDATEQDLKRAYKKKALELHPDKHGGDGEPFKKMKYAYDVLLDPKKRTAYDKYGEAGVRMVDGQMSPDVAMEVFLNIGMRERMTLVLILTLMTSFVLLFPILVCIKWDHPKALTFVQVFIPVWLILSAICCCCCCCVRAPSIDEAEDDEDVRRSVEEIQAQTRKLRCNGYVIVFFLTMLFALLARRLDGKTKWSFFGVIWPWMLLEFTSLLFYLNAAEQLFVIAGGDPEILAQGRWFQLEWLSFVLGMIRSNIVHLVFATLLALKLDGKHITWWTVFMPVWVDRVVSMVQNFSRCNSVKSQAELEQMPEEERAQEVTRASIVCDFIFQSISLGFVVLLCNKLQDPKAYSAYIVFLPVFLSAGCFCCCLSCAVFTVSPPHTEDEETGLGGAREEHYGST